MPVSYWYVTSHTKLAASNDSSASVMFLQSGLGSACPVALTGHVHMFSTSNPPDRGQRLTCLVLRLDDWSDWGCLGLLPLSVSLQCFPLYKNGLSSLRILAQGSLHDVSRKQEIPKQKL